MTTSRDAATTKPPASTTRPARARWVAGALAGAWLLPLGTHLVGADWLLPPLILLGLMSLQRAGRTVLDRLVLAVAQLFGTLCVAGLLLSVWPWHLHPVAVAGSAFTGLVALAVLTGRRPALPRRLPARDTLTGLAALAVAVLAVVPFALRDVGGRLGLVAPGEDFARHFKVYDMIGALGGYAFLHPAGAAPYEPVGYGIVGYPQGTHFLYAVLDRFARSSNVNADPATAMDMLLWCHVGTYVFLALAMLWSVRRVVGPGPSVAALLLVLAGTAGVVYFGDPLTVFLRGFPNEMLGLALVAILTAVVARPLPRLGEQVATVVTLLIGVSFSYHLFLPYALVVAAVWAWRHRRARHRTVAAVLAVVLLAPVLLLTPLLNRPTSTSNQLLLKGTASVVDRTVLLVVVLVAAAGLLLRGGLRAPSRRVLAVALAVAVVLVVGLFGYQYVMIGRSVYYFEKLLHMLLVVGLVAAASAARLYRSRRLAPAIAASVVVIALMAGLGGRWHTQSLTSPGLRYGLGWEKGSPAGGRAALDLARRYPPGDGTVDVVLTGTPYANFYATLYLSVMRHTYRYGEAWYVFLAPGTPRTQDDLDERVRASPVPVRFFVAPGASANEQAARSVAARYPDKVEVVVVG